MSAENNQSSYSIDLTNQVKNLSVDSPVPSRVRQRLETYTASPTPKPQGMSLTLHCLYLNVYSYRSKTDWSRKA